MIPKPDTILFTPFTPEQFQYWFSRKDITCADTYYLVRLLAPRKGPGTRCFLLVPIQDPVYTFVVWNVEQVPADPRGVIANGAFYFIDQEEEYWLSTADLGDLLTAITREEWYSVLHHPEPEVMEKMQSRIYRK